MLEWICHESPLRTSFAATVSTQGEGQMLFPFYIESAKQKAVKIQRHIFFIASKTGGKASDARSRMQYRYNINSVPPSLTS